MCFHGLVYDFCELWIVADKEPRINGDAVASHAGAGLEYVDTRVHVADFDNLIHIHIVVATDATEFVGEGKVDGAEGILHHLCHLGGAYVGNYDVALAES